MATRIWDWANLAWRLTMALWVVRFALRLAVGGKLMLGLHLLAQGLMLSAVVLTFVALVVDLFQDAKRGVPRRTFGTLALASCLLVWVALQGVIRSMHGITLMQLLNGIVAFLHALAVIPVLSLLGLIFDRTRKRALIAAGISVAAVLLGTLKR